MGVLITPILTPAIARAEDTNNLEGSIAKNECNGNDLSLKSGNTSAKPCSGDATGLNNLLDKVINVFSLIVGAIAVIMIIVGGFRYVISSGNDQAVGGAKNTIIFALVGLVIVALAQFLVHFVIGQL